ncbi:LpqB family beta-propeller domain-containing protein [Streptacidiphilus sp. EB129]|uniref:LpqB family beta-propeller domain-containing protein n=1 Tax=Streptacidiphilus sp. EB129 TaxID=3156262 RepID=UPI0035167EA3
MPDSGAPPRPTGGEQTGGQNSQVVVVAVPPSPDASPDQLLSGFLDGLVADEADYHTAKEYLDPGTAWSPQDQVAIVDSVSQPTLVAGSVAGGRVTLQVEGRELGTLDAKNAYAPGNGQPISRKFEFVRGKDKRWRIDSLQPGVIINQSDFQRIYESVDLYYPAARQGVDAVTYPLVPEPVYLRGRIDPLTSAANALLTGPSDWLQHVVQQDFPAGSSIDGPQSLASGDQGNVDIHLQGPAADVIRTNHPDCVLMASQFFATLSQVPTQQLDQAPQPVKSVTLYDGKDGSARCQGSSRNSSAFPPAGDTSYYLDAGGHLKSLDMGSGNAARAVAGAQLPTAAGVVSGFAVSPGVSGDVALLTQDGRRLYLGNLNSATEPTRQAVPGNVQLGSPSWDSTGTLWMVDKGSGAGSVKALVGQMLLPVAVEGLHGQVTGVRVATDGARIALTVSSDGRSSVQIGRVHYTGTPQQPQLTIEALQSIAPSLSTINAVSWVDGDSVIVLGRSELSAEGLTVQQIDGSSALIPGPQPPSATDGIQSISALQQDPTAPLLAYANTPADGGKIMRWQPSSNTWVLLPQTGAGTTPMPSYPG